MKILVAIKDSLLAKSIESYVYLSGHELLARSIEYEDTQRLIKRLNPECVITGIFPEDEYGLTIASNVKDFIIPFIFVDSEANKERFLKSRKYPVSRYVVFPVDMFSFWSVLDEIQDSNYSLSSSLFLSGKYLFVRKNNLFEKISIPETDYLYSEGNYTTIHKGDEKYIIKYSLTRLLEYQTFDSLMRVHRNYAVHKREISEIDFAKRTLLVRGIQIPFGRTYTKSIRSIMNLLTK